MKLTVIGNYGPTPALLGATSSYLIEGENTKILLDFGCGALSKLDAFCDIEKVDAIVLSHTHYDHCCDLLPLSYKLKSKIKLYLPPNQENGLAGELKKIGMYDIAEYSKDSVIRIGDFTLSFAQMIHPVTSFAIKIEQGATKFVYTGDTIYNDKLVDFCKGATMVLADALQREEVKNPHMTVMDAHVLQTQINCTILCTHEPPTNCGNCEKYPYLRKVKAGSVYNISEQNDL